MRKTRIGLLLLAVAGLLVATGAASSATDQSETNRAGALCTRALEASQRGFDKAFDDRDAHRLTSFYHRDATLINPFGTIRSSKADIEAAFTGLFANPLLSTVRQLSEVVEGCQTAVVVSDFLLTDPSDNSSLHFLASLSWTFDHGRWQVLMDQSTALG